MKGVAAMLPTAPLCSSLCCISANGSEAAVIEVPTSPNAYSPSSGSYGLKLALRNEENAQAQALDQSIDRHPLVKMHSGSAEDAGREDTDIEEIKEFMVHIHRDESMSLGMDIALYDHKGEVYVNKIKEDGAMERYNRRHAREVEEGDAIVSINDVGIRQLTMEEITNTLRYQRELYLLVRPHSARPLKLKGEKDPLHNKEFKEMTGMSKASGSSGNTREMTSESFVASGTFLNRLVYR
mmetsp:Transcript_43106/g.99280  ORF Transcript_43106/g.99280 Transcript_43106/m.99280 type:complete len:239 (-) Transcript_43106:72-788(-)